MAITGNDGCASRKPPALATNLQLPSTWERSLWSPRIVVVFFGALGTVVWCARRMFRTDPRDCAGVRSGSAWLANFPIPDLSGAAEIGAVDLRSVAAFASCRYVSAVQGERTKVMKLEDMRVDGSPPPAVCTSGFTRARSKSRTVAAAKCARG